MKVSIIETQETQELVYTVNSICCVSDIVGDDDQFEFLEEQGIWRTSQENFDWWELYFKKLKEYDNDKEEVLGLVRDRDEDGKLELKFEGDLFDAANCDIGDQPDAMKIVCAEWKEKLEIK